MNLLSCLRSFLAWLPKKKLAAAALVAAFAALTAFQAVPAFAQQNAAAPVEVASEQGIFDTINSNASSITCTSGAGSCLLQVISLIVTFIFSVISYFLSKLLIVLTSILITFARYNKFNTAPPVEIGWVIVRDISNMFFIVILLASAFMTIIGKAEEYGMHYSKVIPKLLVAAVLVNFSRTLMLLAIDFSQVVMLTFVSAFEGTIAGNLIQGLGITQMVRLQDAQNAAGGAGDAAVNLVNISLAYLLSIFLLTTAVATILIYVGFFIFRIVGLWMLIIASPAAFLAGSLPGKAGGVLGQVTGQFSKKLTAFLVQGPMIAFWLWLTFATIQQTASSGGLASSGIGFDFPQNDTLGFITRIGTAPQLAGFIVGVVMLTMGFAAVTSVAKEVGMGLDGFADDVKKYKSKAFGWFARAPVLPFKYGGKGIYRGGRALFNGLDKKHNLSGQLGAGMARGAGGLPAGAGALSQVGGALGSLARFVPVIGGAAATAGAGALIARRGGLLGADKKALEDRMGSIDRLPPAERVAALRELGNSPGADLLMGQTIANKQHEELSKDENRKAFLEQLKGEEKERLEAQATAAGVALTGSKQAEARKAEIGRQATAIAERRLADDEGARIQKLQEFAKTAHDDARTDALKKEATKKMVYANDADYQSQVKKMVDDKSKFKEVDASQFKSGKFALAVLQQAGVTDPTATTLDGARLNTLREDLKDQKELVETIDLVAKQIGVTSKAAIETSARQKDRHDQPRLYSTIGDGDALYTAVERTALTNIDAAVAGRTRGQPLSAQAQSAVRAGLDAGLPVGMIMDQVDKIDAAGVSDGVAMGYIATLGADTIATAADAGEAVHRLGELIDTAKKKASQDQRAQIAGAALASQAAIDKVFGDYKNLTGQRKKEVSDILRELVVLEGSIQAKLDRGQAISASEQLVIDGLPKLRAEVFPEAKISIPGRGEVNPAPSGIRSILYGS